MLEMGMAERRGVIKVWNARFQRIIDSVGSCQGRNETNWAGPRQVNQPNACALEQTLMHGQMNVCIYVHSSHRHSHDAQKSSCCRWTLNPLPTSASASGRCAIITCRDGALTRATSKNDDEFAWRMPPTTNGHGKNQWSCGLSLYLQIASAVAAAGCEKDNRSVSVLGCIRYAILRTKLTVVEVVRGHCAVIQKECGWLCKRKH